VIGSGTILDSSRSRRRVGERYGAATENVHAYVVGEHGESQVALLSSARIGGTPLQEFNDEHSSPHEDEVLRRIADSARRGGEDIARAKGATNYGIGAALTRIATAILRDEHAVLTVSTAIPETMDLGQVSLSVPAIIGPEGVQRVLPIRLSDEEMLMSGVVPDLSRQPRQDLTETFAREAGDAGFDGSRVSRPGLLTS
jgi:L-lactate dehydrogenase